MGKDVQTAHPKLEARSTDAVSRENLSKKWRLLSVVALGVYALLLVSVFWFLLQNLLVSALLIVTSGILAYAAWLVFSGHGRRKTVGYAIGIGSVIALTAEILSMFLAIRSIRTLLVFLLLMATYVLLVSRLRNEYWKEKRVAGEHSSFAAHFTNPYLIINPKSGNGRAIKANIEELAQEQGINVILLRKGDDVESLARHAADAGADVLGISGGDGSIGAVVKVAVERKLPLVVLPGGTRCHFARDIGLDPEHIADALSGFNGVPQQIDIGDINGRIFLNNASFGLYADIIDNPEYREHKLDTTRNVLQALASGTKHPYDLVFRHAEHQYRHAAQVLVGVNRYKMLNVFELGRRKVLDAGVLQVTVIHRLDDQVVRSMMRTLSIDTLLHGSKKGDIEQWDTHAFQISNNAETIVAGVDGEREEFRNPVRLRILPKALTIYVPAEGRKSRPEPIFSPQTVGHMHDVIRPAKTRHA